MRPAGDSVIQVSKQARRKLPPKIICRERREELDVQNDILGLSGKVALVTGASRGIGRAVVDLLAKQGTRVAVNYVSDRKAASDAVVSARKFGVYAIAVQADISKLEEGNRAVQETLEHFGRLDFLICNAGIWQGDLVESISEELWDRTLAINLKGTWTVCRAAVPVMKRQEFVRIVI